MGDIKRHMQVGSTGIADGTLDTVDIKDASVTAAKFSALFEHGTVEVANSKGTYLVFDTDFGGTPTIVVTGVGAAGTVPQLNHTPTSGSVHIDLSTSGTIVVHYEAWGVR